MDIDLFQYASSIADCVCSSLQNRYVDDRVLDADGNEILWRGSCCVFPGTEVAWDNCCGDKVVNGQKQSGGQAWVTLQGASPTTNFPDADTRGLSRCDDGHSLAARFQIGVLRCACQDNCDCDIKEATADAVFKDLQAMLRGLNCCFNADTGCGDREWRLLGFDTVGPDGGCVGSTISIVVNIPMPCCTTTGG